MVGNQDPQDLRRRALDSLSKIRHADHGRAREGELEGQLHHCRLYIVVQPPHRTQERQIPMQSSHAFHDAIRQSLFLCLGLFPEIALCLGRTLTIRSSGSISTTLRFPHPLQGQRPAPPATTSCSKSHGL